MRCLGNVTLSLPLVLLLVLHRITLVNDTCNELVIFPGIAFYYGMRMIDFLWIEKEVSFYYK